MASIAKDPNGRRRLQFVDPDGKRRTIRLGKLPKRAAEMIQTKVEHLLAAKTSGCSWDTPTAQWVADLPDALADKLAHVGLIPARERATLGPFLAGYCKQRFDVKPATQVVWRHTRQNLVEFFGKDTILGDVTSGDADRFRLYLIGKEYAPTTVAKRLGFARQFFNAARKDRLIGENPFRDVSHKAAPDATRKRFITQEETTQLLEAAPSADWRAIVALCRYGGLRCPSEVLSLKWEGVDWGRKRIRVDSPKTEHLPGKASRVIPLFPELEPILAEAWELAPDRAQYVIGRDDYRKAAQGRDGWVNCNLRTQFTRIIRWAGLEPWPKLFHNLRASRETELTREHPLHVVTDWIGNTPTIALRHYLQVVDMDFDKALQCPDKAAQNAAQYAHETGSTVLHAKPQTPSFSEECETLQHCTSVQVEAAGIEPASRDISAQASTCVVG